MATIQTAAATQTANSQSDTVGATVTAFGISYAITSIFSALLVVLKELSAGVHDGLAAITGHHWVTHGLLNVIVFVVLGMLLSRANRAPMPVASLVNVVIGSTIVSGLIIAGFFLIVG